MHKVTMFALVFSERQFNHREQKQFHLLQNKCIINLHPVISQSFLHHAQTDGSVVDKLIAPVNKKPQVKGIKLNKLKAVQLNTNDVQIFMMVVAISFL
jgi:hypothetical protein